MKRVIALVLIAGCMLSGCVFSSQLKPADEGMTQVTPAATKTPVSVETPAPAAPAPLDYFPLENGGQLDRRFVDEWIGQTYVILGKTYSQSLYVGYEVDFTNSIDLKITIHEDGTGWLSYVPVSTAVYTQTDQVACGAKLTTLAAHDGFAIFRWDGWEYPVDASLVTVLPETGVIHLGCYPRNIKYDTPILETEVLWGIDYIPDYALVGDIVSADGDVLYRITFDIYEKKLTLPFPLDSVFETNLKIPYLLDKSISKDGTVQLLSEIFGKAASHQYFRYFDPEGREHVKKFKSWADGCRLIEIDNKMLVAEPRFYYHNETDFTFYFINLISFDAAAGSFSIVSSSYPEFYHEAYSWYYDLAKMEPTDDATLSNEITNAKALVFMIEEMLAGRFKGTTREEIHEYLLAHHPGQ